MKSFRSTAFTLLVIMLLFSACSPARSQAPSGSNKPAPTQRPEPTVNMTAVIDEAVDKAIDELLAGSQQGPKAPTHPLLGAPTISEEESFLRYVESNLNKTWGTIYPDKYYAPKMMYISQGPTYDHACDGSPSQVAGGPVYCPSDKTVYYPATQYFDYRLTRPLSQTGDFAIAYLLAHEYGHHIQTIFDIEAQAYDPKNDFGTAQERGVKYELQADCLAGVWANSVYYQGYLEKGDIEEAIEASSEAGDDVMSNYTLDKSQFTHGSGHDRYAWFMYGYNNGNPQMCNPFAMGMSPPSQPSDNGSGSGNNGGQSDAQKDPVLSFFVAANDTQYCQVLDDGSSDTVLTYRCTYNDNFHADFDQWVSEAAITDYISSLRGSGNLTYDETWSSSKSGESGQIIAFNTTKGAVALVWAVNGKPLTGTAVLSNSTDLQAVIDWFNETGYHHYFNKP